MIAVIYITKGKIVGAKADEKKLKIDDSYQLGWDTNTLDISISQLIQKLKNKKIRILLDNSFAYVLRFTVPKNLKEFEERKFISDRIAEKIPEFLNDKDWDYKEIQFSLSQNNVDVDLKDKEVVVFSPVKYITDILSKTVLNLGLVVEAIEPVEIASTRNENPIIGLALKKDLNGSDREVLNISIDKSRKDEDFKDILTPQTQEKQDFETSSPDNTDNTENVSESYKQEERSGKKKVIITVILLIIIIIFLSALGYMIYSQFFSKRSVESNTKVIASPTEIPQISITPTDAIEEPVDVGKYRILLKNGSGVRGEAQNAVTLLEAVGFKNFTTGNADSYNHITTQISVNSDFPKEVLEAIKNTLSANYNVATGSSVLQDSGYDIEVIVGVKK